jgi:hypothetical protein
LASLNFSEQKKETMETQSWDFDAIARFLTSNVTQQDGGHLVWMDKEAYTVARVDVLGPGFQIAAHQLFFMCRQRQPVPKTHKLVRSCEVVKCISHHDLIPRLGNPASRMEDREVEHTKRRFERHCEHRVASDCINWTGYINPASGYGKIHFNGKPRYAHDVAWMLAHRADIPPRPPYSTRV